KKLAADAPPAAALSALAELMKRNKLDPSPLLAAARVKYPKSFELAFALGQWHRLNKDTFTASSSFLVRLALRQWHRFRRALEELGAYQAGLALRPDNVAARINLGTALHDRDDLDGAAAALETAIRRDDKNVLAYFNLGNVRKAKGNRRKAEGDQRGGDED